MATHPSVLLCIVMQPRLLSYSPSLSGVLSSVALIVRPRTGWLTRISVSVSIVFKAFPMPVLFNNKTTKQKILRKQSLQGAQKCVAEQTDDFTTHRAEIADGTSNADRTFALPLQHAPTCVGACAHERMGGCVCRCLHIHLAPRGRSRGTSETVCSKGGEREVEHSTTSCRVTRHAPRATRYALLITRHASRR
jgi:hypothetical protein